MGNCLHPDTPCQLLCSVINIVMYNCDCNFKHSHVQLYTFVFSNKARFSHTSTVTVTRLDSCYGKTILTLTLTLNKIYFDINEKDKQQEIDNMISRYE